MRKVFAIAIVAMIAAPALADESLDSTNSFGGASGGISERMAVPPAFSGAHSAFSDNFEAEAVRHPFAGVSTLWTSEWADNTSIVSPGLSGSSRAAEHASDGSAISGFELNSPQFGDNVLDMAFTATVKITGMGTRYDFITTDTESQLYNTRVMFQPDGAIWGTRVNSSLTAFETFDTGATWTSGQEMEISVETTSGGNVIVRKDGVELYTEVETSYAVGGGFLVGGIGQYLTYATNANDSSTFDIDNIRFVPEPATLALLLLGGATMIRRRR
jgi:hypothetical protein